MAKKRKAHRGADQSKDGELGGPPASESRLRVNTYEDVADSEDEFHINRDKVLLEEGPAQKRQRRAREEDEFLEFSDEEVLSASPSIGDSEDLDDESDDGVEEKRARLSKSKRLGLEDSESEASRAPSEDEDMGGWGTSKEDYYDADVIETEADALEEEREARRLQQKQLQGMTEADFGFNEAEWLDAGKGGEDEEDEDEDGRGRSVLEVLPQLEIADEMLPEERLQILRTRYPEFEPLSKEFLELQEVYKDLKLAAEAAVAVRKHNAARVDGTSGAEEDRDKIPVAALKHTTLSAYLAALCMYFALLTSGPASANGKSTAMPPAELRDHPIMDSLMQTRTLWTKVKDLVLPDPPSPNISFLPLPAVATDDQPTNGAATGDPKPTSPAPAKKPRKRKTRAEKAAAEALVTAATRRAERLQETEASLASLSALTQAPSRPTKLKPSKPLASDTSSDLGDPVSIPPQEAARKAAVKKSLKFYTSQIASKAQKRETAGRDAGGDADLPYKERLRERQERLNAMAEKRGQKGKGEDLGGEEMDEDEGVIARDIREGEDEYYDLISSRSAQRKAEKASRSAALSEQSTQGTTQLGDENGERDGKRKVSYAIEKNKGLAPKRKKEVRNPRVKKRRKYEEKKKKLGSVRQVYRGGEGRRYEGEKTGIKGGLVRSVKL